MVWAQNWHHHMPASYPQDAHNVDLGLPTGIHVTHISCQYSTGLPTQVQMCSTTHFTLVHESIISKKQWSAQYRSHTGNQDGGLRVVKLLWYISKIMLLSLSLEYLPCKYIVYCWVLCSVKCPFFLLYLAPVVLTIKIGCAHSEVTALCLVELVFILMFTFNLVSRQNM